MKTLVDVDELNLLIADHDICLPGFISKAQAAKRLHGFIAAGIPAAEALEKQAIGSEEVTQAIVNLQGEIKEGKARILEAEEKVRELERLSKKPDPEKWDDIEVKGWRLLSLTANIDHGYRIIFSPNNDFRLSSAVESICDSLASGLNHIRSKISIPER